MTVRESGWVGVGVNAYGQPDRKISIFYAFPVHKKLFLRLPILVTFIQPLLNFKGVIFFAPADLGKAVKS